MEMASRNELYQDDLDGGFNFDGYQKRQDNYYQEEFKGEHHQNFHSEYLVKEEEELLKPILIEESWRPESQEVMNFSDGNFTIPNKKST